MGEALLWVLGLTPACGLGSCTADSEWPRGLRSGLALLLLLHARFNPELDPRSTPRGVFFNGNLLLDLLLLLFFEYITIIRTFPQLIRQSQSESTKFCMYTFSV